MLGDDGIARLGGIDCATELAVIGVAGERFIAREARDPESLDELADDLDAPATRWTYAVGDDEPAPVAGSGCIELSVPTTSIGAERRTLEVAAETYRAREGGRPDDQQALVDSGLLFQATPGFEIVDGVPVAPPGTECDLQLDDEIAGGCATDYRTLQVAIEACLAQTGLLPDNERQLVDADVVRRSFATWDVVYGELVAGDGSGCEPPG